MRAISLFSGAGGMDIGFKAAGFSVVAANEFDRHACSTFRTNHPEVELHEGDIVECMPKIGSYRNIDVVFGGPPCQGFSVAGKMSPDDPRSQLVFRFADVVDRVRPRVFVMENVRALAALSKFAELRKELIYKLSKCGYRVSMHILNSRDFGVPQSRERVFFIGVRVGTPSIKDGSFNRLHRQPPTLREAIKHFGRAGTPSNSRTCNAKVTLAAKPVLRRSPYAGMMFNGQGRPLNPDGWSSTLPASMGGNRTPIVDEEHLYNHAPAWVEMYHRHLIDGGEPFGMYDAPHYLRRITVDEAAHLQGFPATYTFQGPTSRVFCQIGNAVPCKLAEAVATVVRESLEGIVVKTVYEGLLSEPELELS